MTKRNTSPAKNQVGETITKTRVYGTVVYPESAPEHWTEILADTHVAAFVSPLHDKDVNADGGIKKPHYHVLLNFDGPKTPKQAEELFASFGGVGREVVNSFRGYARYLCHLDNPEKAQYSVDDVQCFGGADFCDAIGLPSDKYAVIREMQSFCRQYEVCEFCDLMDYASDYREDWFRVLCDNGAFVMREYLKSRRWHSTEVVNRDYA